MLRNEQTLSPPSHPFHTLCDRVISTFIHERTSATRTTNCQVVCHHGTPHMMERKQGGDTPPTLGATRSTRYRTPATYRASIKLATRTDVSSRRASIPGSTKCPPSSSRTKGVDVRWERKNFAACKHHHEASKERAERTATREQGEAEVMRRQNIKPHSQSQGPQGLLGEIQTI